MAFDLPMALIHATVQLEQPLGVVEGSVAFA